MKKLIILCAALAVAFHASAIRPVCGSARPNVQLYTPPGDAGPRIAVADAFPSQFPAQNVYGLARALVYDRNYNPNLPSGGVKCEETRISVGQKASGKNFDSVGYYQYALNTSAQARPGMEWEIKTSGSEIQALKGGQPIAFGEIIFDQNRGIKLYLITDDYLARKDPKITIYADAYDSSLGGLKNAAIIASAPFTRFYRQFDLSFRWVNINGGSKIETIFYGYENFDDPNYTSTSRFQISNGNFYFNEPILMVDTLRVGSIEKTDAFLDGLSNYEVMTIGSIRWLTQ